MVKSVRVGPRASPTRRGAGAEPRRRAGTASPRRLPAAERRARILETALPLFAARGRDGTTTRDLARAAGVTEPVLYRHFPSKEELFAAVLDLVLARLIESMERALEGSGDAASRMAALARCLPELLAERRDEFRVLNSVAATQARGAAGARVREAYARLGRFLSDALATAGLRSGVDATTAGHLLLEIGLGASLTRPLGVAAVVRDGYGDDALRLLLDAFTTSRAR
jgi:AcrR family transcriptional regulator